MKNYLAISAALLLGLSVPRVQAQCVNIEQNASVGINFQNGIYFINDNMGFVVGGAGVSQTMDGGQSWKVKNLKDAGNIKGVHFYDAMLGIVSSYPNNSGMAYIAITNDGGVTWSPKISNATKLLRKPHFASPKEVWAVGDGGTVVHSSDGGNTWTLKRNINNDTSASLLDVDFPTPQLGFIGGQWGNLLRTVDGGNTWQRMLAVTDSNSIFSIDFLNPLNGIAAGTRNAVFVTQDGGATWTKRYCPIQNGRGVNMISPDTIYISGSGGVFKSVDAARTWINLYPGPKNAQYNDMHFPSHRVGYACGSGSVFIKIRYDAAPPIANFLQNGTTLVAPAAPGYQYQWYVDSIPVPGGNTGTLEPEVSGMYRVRVTLNDCSTLSAPQFITVQGGVANQPKLIDKSVLNVYPNPAHDNFTVEYKDLKGDQTLLIYNVMGVLVKTVLLTPDANGRDKVQINTAGWGAGIYHLKAGHAVQRLVVE